MLMMQFRYWPPESFRFRFDFYRCMDDRQLIYNFFNEKILYVFDEFGVILAITH